MAAPDDPGELRARSAYCKMFGHDLTVVKADGGELVLHCTNRCSVDKRYKVVHRGAET